EFAITHALRSETGNIGDTRASIDEQVESQMRHRPRRMARLEFLRLLFGPGAMPVGVAAVEVFDALCWVVRSERIFRIAGPGEQGAHCFDAHIGGFGGFGLCVADSGDYPRSDLPIGQCSGQLARLAVRLLANLVEDAPAPRAGCQRVEAKNGCRGV